MPSSQDSTTRAFLSNHISRTFLLRQQPPPPPTMRSSRRPPRPKQKPKEYLRCAQWPRCRRSHGVPQMEVSSSMWGKNKEVSCCLKTVWDNCAVSTRAACIACGTIRSQRCRRCNLCGSDTPLRETSRWGHLPGQTTAWHQDAASGPAPGRLLSELRQALAMALPAMCGLSLRHGLGRKSRRGHE